MVMCIKIYSYMIMIYYCIAQLFCNYRIIHIVYYNYDNDELRLPPKKVSTNWKKNLFCERTSVKFLGLR